MKIVLRIVALCLLPLAVWTTAKFFFSHHFAPTQSGIQGYARHSPVEILFVGSSHTRQSYDPLILEQETGRSVFLVAYNGFDPYAMKPFVEQVLRDAVRRPKLIVIEAYPGIFSRYPEIQDTRYFSEADSRLKLEFLRRFIAVQQSSDGYLDSFALVVNRGNEGIFGFPLTRAVIDKRSLKGGYLGKSMPGLSENAFRKLHLPITTGTANALQIEAMREILRLARESGIPMVLVESPLPEPVELQPEMQSLKRAVKGMIQSEGFTYFDGGANFPITEPRYFADSNHLSGEGRVLFSRKVGEFIGNKDLASLRPKQ